jgi:phosphatidylserine/phosphatidylglycerophosphate/cardiolipin synthase-like enzyme
VLVPKDQTASWLPVFLGRIDSALGMQIERAVMSHHKRRLGRLGQVAALETRAPGWASQGARPQAGNRFEVLVDGSEALPGIAQAIAEARCTVWLAGWFFSPEFRLSEESDQTLQTLLAEVAERADVRVLAWAGAPLPLFHPDRREVRTAIEELTKCSRVRVALDARERPLHCHHEKIIIIDGELAFVGGIDLTSYGGDRLDTRDHPPRGSIGWHDAAARLRGPAVADVARHFALRWEEVTDERLPLPARPNSCGDTELQIVRTVPERIYRRLPRGEFGIVESYLRALHSAKRLVYLENQFLWSPEIVSVLADKLSSPPDERFRLLTLLPAKPNNGNDDTRGQLGVLAQADGGAGRFLACTLYQRGAGARPVYVHAKVAVVDDRWLTLGSANLNEHSLFNDTELNVVTHDPQLARETRLRLWSEHLDRPTTELEADPTEIIDNLWRPLANEQLRRRQAAQPLSHTLVLLPHISRRLEGLRGPLNGLLVDG